MRHEHYKNNGKKLHFTVKIKSLGGVKYELNATQRNATLTTAT